MIRTYSSAKKEGEGRGRRRLRRTRPVKSRIEPKAGLNRLAWDMRILKPALVPKAVVWGTRRGAAGRARDVLGAAQVRGRDAHPADRGARASRTSPRPAEDLKSQFRLLSDLRDRIEETHDAVGRIRDVKAQVAADRRARREARKGDDAEGSRQDALGQADGDREEAREPGPEVEPGRPELPAGARPPADRDRRRRVSRRTRSRPTPSWTYYKEVARQLAAILSELDGVLGKDLADFNAEVRREEIPPVVVVPRKKTGSTQHRAARSPRRRCWSRSLATKLFFAGHFDGFLTGDDLEVVETALSYTSDFDYAPWSLRNLFHPVVLVAPLLRVGRKPREADAGVRRLSCRGADHLLLHRNDRAPLRAGAPARLVDRGRPRRGVPLRGPLASVGLRRHSVSAADLDRAFLLAALLLITGSGGLLLRGIAAGVLVALACAVRFSEGVLLLPLLGFAWFRSRDPSSARRSGRRLRSRSPPLPRAVRRPDVGAAVPTACASSSGSCFSVPRRPLPRATNPSGTTSRTSSDGPRPCISL